MVFFGREVLSGDDHTDQFVGVNQSHNCGVYDRIENVENTTLDEPGVGLDECKNDTYAAFIESCAPNRYIKIMCLNVQGIRDATHFENLMLIVNDSDMQIIVITETWLRTYMPNKTFEIRGYKMVRCDRKAKKGDAEKGGGICCYIRDEYKTKKVTCSNSNVSYSRLIEFLFIEIKTKFGKVLLCCVYRLKACPKAATDDFFEYINTISVGYQDTIVCGDFNINALTDDSLYAALNRNFHRCNDRCPTYIVPCFEPSQIDLFLSKIKYRVVKYGHFTALGISNHQAIYMLYNILPNKKRVQTYTFRSYNKINVEQINHAANKIEWDRISRLRQVDEKTETFVDMMQSLLETNIPLKTIKLRNPPVSWFNENIRHLVKKRKTIYDMWKINRNHGASKIVYNGYRKINNETKNAIQKAKLQQFEFEFRKTSNSKEKWNLINSLGVTKARRQMKCTDLPKGITVETLNRFFTKLEPIPLENKNLASVESEFKFRYVEQQDVVDAILKIKSTCTGSDGLPPRFFKLVLPSIIEPITDIVNSSFQSGRCPDILKKVIVSPIAKNDEPMTENDFRPISRANFLLKIISTICNSQLIEYVEQNEIIGKEQSGFRMNHSCTTSMIQITEEFHSAIAQGNCVIMVLLDLASAFPSVDHNILIQVIESIGVRGVELAWFSDFLRNWCQVVEFGGIRSHERLIERGIIQGETNAHLLFSIFFNRIISVVKHCEIRLFADDTQIYLESSIADIDMSIEKVNSDLAKINEFCVSFGLQINPAKSQAIVVSSKYNASKIDYDLMIPIHINQQIVKFYESVKSLGYYIDRTMSENYHVSKVLQKSYCAMSNISHLRRTLPEKVKLQLVNALVVPVFDYMDVVYDGHGAHGTNQNSDSLEKMMNVCVRFVSGLGRRDHVSEFRNRNRLLTLANRRLIHNLNMVHRIVNGRAPGYLDSLIKVNDKNKRAANKIIVRKTKNTFHKRSFAISMPASWNRLPDELRCESNLNSFKMKLKKLLLEKQKSG